MVELEHLNDARQGLGRVTGTVLKALPVFPCLSGVKKVRDQTLPS
jgi:hypothetical protein